MSCVLYIYHAKNILVLITESVGLKAQLKFIIPGTNCNSFGVGIFSIFICPIEWYEAIEYRCVTVQVQIIHVDGARSCLGFFICFGNYYSWIFWKLICWGQTTVLMAQHQGSWLAELRGKLDFGPQTLQSDKLIQDWPAQWLVSTLALLPKSHNSS